MRPLILIVVFFCWSCDPLPYPKPKGQLALEYPKPKYVLTDFNCPYTFYLNNFSIVRIDKDCAVHLQYPKLKATIYVTYFEVNDNFNLLIKEVESRLETHSQFSMQVTEGFYENRDQNVYGSIFELVGDAASNIQFFATDKKNHFLSGSLIFEAQPNYDSLYPAIQYVKQDMRKLLESLQWE